MKGWLLWRWRSSMSLAIAALAVSVSTFLANGWRDRRDLLLRVHERLVTAAADCPGPLVAGSAVAQVCRPGRLAHPQFFRAAGAIPIA